jgi:hypothetical protein
MIFPAFRGRRHGPINAVEMDRGEVAMPKGDIFSPKMKKKMRERESVKDIEGILARIWQLTLYCSSGFPLVSHVRLDLGWQGSGRGRSACAPIGARGDREMFVASAAADNFIRRRRRDRRRRRHELPPRSRWRPPDIPPCHWLPERGLARRRPPPPPLAEEEERALSPFLLSPLPFEGLSRARCARLNQGGGRRKEREKRAPGISPSFSVPGHCLLRRRRRRRHRRRLNQEGE